MRSVGDKSEPSVGGSLDEETREGLKRFAQMLRAQKKPDGEPAAPKPARPERKNSNVIQGIETKSDGPVSPVSEVLSLAEFQMRKQAKKKKSDYWDKFRRELGLRTYHRLLDDDPNFAPLGQNIDRWA